MIVKFDKEINLKKALSQLNDLGCIEITKIRETKGHYIFSFNAKQKNITNITLKN